MSKATSPFIVGDFWLDKRRDGKSPDIWQIAFVKGDTNSITYKSTKARDIGAAKRAIETFLLTSRQGAPAIRTPAPPNLMAVPVIPHLYRYWELHGQHTITAKTIIRHLREFKAFLEQDCVGPNATFDDMGKHLFERYRSWTMAARSFTVEWDGQTYQSRSKGVSGATYRRSFASVKAALNLAYEDRIVPHLWRFPAFPPDLKSPPRTRILTMEEVGAMIAYVTEVGDLALLHWIWIMLATGVRPVAGSQLVPSNQWDSNRARLDLHPRGWQRTTKRNPRVPVIPQLLALLLAHEGPWIPAGVKHQTLNRRWRVMRDALGFSEEVVPKALRYTVATELADASVSELHIAMLLGHVVRPSWQSREVVSPRYYDAVTPTLSRMWDEAHIWADKWIASYAVVVTRRGAKRVVRRDHQRNLDLHDNDAGVLASLSRRQLREERAVPCPFTGHGCSIESLKIAKREHRLFDVWRKGKLKHTNHRLDSDVYWNGETTEQDILAFIARN